MSSIILIAALSEPARIAIAVSLAIVVAVVVVIASHSVLLALVAAAVVGGVAYYFSGGGQSSESSPSKPPVTIEVTYHEIVIPIRFIPNEDNKDKSDHLSPTKPFCCKLKIDDNWILIEGSSQTDMLNQIQVRFLELKNKQASDSKIVNNKKTETSFRIEVYKKPFPGDTILSELQKLSSECFKNYKYVYEKRDEEYPESENEGDDKQ